MTAGLVARLRDAATRIGYYNTKGMWEPGAATLVREAADALDAARASHQDCHDEAKRVVEAAEQRIKELETERNALQQFAKRETRAADDYLARLAAAERVVEAARELVPGIAPFLYDSPYTARYSALRNALAAYDSQNLNLAKQREET